MIVVADTAPINYLILIEEIEILTKMYGTVVIPRGVREGTVAPFSAGSGSQVDRRITSWLQVRSPAHAPDPAPMAGGKRILPSG
ncbi:MAG: hypothetical protein DMG49_22595 [Acidobacteria bacterium]|nr:MAG: hypothetical protein DMG49_22595 [Acidobacteriota bacterium]